MLLKIGGVAGVFAIFAGSALTEYAKDGMMKALQDAYWISKEKNKAK